MFLWVLISTRCHLLCPQVKGEAEAIDLRQDMAPESLAKLDDAVRRNGALEYTTCVLKESLRKYSVVPVVTRTCIEDTELAGYSIPKGTTIVALIQVLCCCCLWACAVLSVWRGCGLCVEGLSSWTLEFGVSKFRIRGCMGG